MQESEPVKFHMRELTDVERSRRTRAKLPYASLKVGGPGIVIPASELPTKYSEQKIRSSAAMWARYQTIKTGLEHKLVCTLQADHSLVVYRIA